jgi:predicted  nucleic acid-binding Zn-ribbon protein
MAVIRTAVAVAVASAIAGEATYYINKSMDHSGEEAAKRNKVMADFQAAQAEYAKQKQAQVDWLNEHVRMESHAEVEYKEVDEAMAAYYEQTGGDRKKIAAVPVVMPEPTLGDFYTPSDTAKKIELVTLVGSLGVTAWIVHKYIW